MSELTLLFSLTIVQQPLILDSGGKRNGWKKDRLLNMGKHSNKFFVRMYETLRGVVWRLNDAIEPT